MTLWICPLSCVQQGETEFQSEARGAHGAFADVRQEVLGRDADGQLLDERSQNVDRGNSTQERFSLSTLTQCDGEPLPPPPYPLHHCHRHVRLLSPVGMVKAGIEACTKWFSDKWAECAKAIQVPVIKHILCVPMKLHFLCNIMRGQQRSLVSHLRHMRDGDDDEDDDDDACVALFLSDDGLVQGAHPRGEELWSAVRSSQHFH